jgi:hypothetical protein
VTAYFVTYPHGGFVDGEYPSDLAIPAWVKFLHNWGRPVRESLTAADLKEGMSLVQVEFGKSTSKPDSHEYYSTTLTNVSDKRVRVLKFGGYAEVGKQFTLYTVTGHFFTVEDFKEWYGQKGEWIEPGHSVTDSNNYGGRPALWAYYCETDGGKEFLTGGIIE